MVRRSNLQGIKITLRSFNSLIAQRGVSREHRSVELFKDGCIFGLSRMSVACVESWTISRTSSLRLETRRRVC